MGWIGTIIQVRQEGYHTYVEVTLANDQDPADSFTVQKHFHQKPSMDQLLAVLRTEVRTVEENRAAAKEMDVLVGQPFVVEA